jgi:sulfur-carrier protein
MRIRARFFALYRDLVGVEETHVDLGTPASAASAVAALRSRGEGYARLPERPVVALNQEFASLDAELADGDELAFLPPLAGG